jgi:hypothetical protein
MSAIDEWMSQASALPSTARAGLAERLLPGPPMRSPQDREPLTRPAARQFANSIGPGVLLRSAISNIE